MSVRLQYPRGGSFSFSRQFIVGGETLDLTGCTLEAFLKYSPEDADADAIAEIPAGVLSAPAGTVQVAIPGSATDGLPLALAYYWTLRATDGAGRVYAPENCHGQVVLTPLSALLLQVLPDTGITEILTPEEEAAAASAATVISQEFRGDLTSAALHRAVITVGKTLPWIVATLESGQWNTWTLRAKGVGETDDGTSYRQPDDFNGSTNNVVWVKTAIS